MQTYKLQDVKFYEFFRLAGETNGEKIYYLPDNAPGSSRSRESGEDGKIYAKRAKIVVGYGPTVNPRGRYHKFGWNQLVEPLKGAKAVDENEV